MKAKVYRLYWRNKKRPDEMGEARPMYNEIDARNMCNAHDLLYPHIQHWYEAE